MTIRDGQEAVQTLVVDDDPDIREGLRAALEREGFPTLEAGDGRTAIHVLEEEEVGLLLLDLELPRVSGMEVLQHVVEHRPDLPVIIVSGTGSIPTAVRSIRLGAFDFLEKPVDATRALQAVRAALGRADRRRRELRTRTEALERYGMVGGSPAITAVYERIDRAAGSDVPVLVTGESGTGKEMVARAIHRTGHRASFPFVAVNCAAIPGSLLESELFGHVRGAFTGASQSHRGKFEQAHRGILFLDEVAELSAPAQATLLRVLEADKIERVGGERPIPVDVSVIAATNRELSEDVSAGRFRKDLFYRLNVIAIDIPPLRERPEDLPDLLEHFVALRMGDGRLPSVTPSALSVLLHHDWPGNVRELRNVVDRMLFLTEEEVISGAVARRAIRRGAEDGSDGEEELRTARTSWEREYITRTLLARDWNIQETADALGIHRSHLWKKMRALGIRPPSE